MRELLRDPLDDLPEATVARGTFWLGVVAALCTVPFAVARAGPDWIEIPMIISALVASAVVVASGIELVVARRRRARRHHAALASPL
jgi:hypothetical protein